MKKSLPESISSLPSTGNSSHAKGASLGGQPVVFPHSLCIMADKHYVEK